MKVNDVLVCKWGYNMVLYDFYKVIGFSPSGKSVLFQQLAAEHLPDGKLWSDPVIPDINKPVGPIKTRRIKDNFIKISPSKFIFIKDIWDNQEIFYENHCD
jgi:hypothetical protein